MSDRPTTLFEAKVLCALGVKTNNNPLDIAAKIGKAGNAGAIVVGQALERLLARGLVSKQFGWCLTTAGADECQLFARMGMPKK